ncbi:hypothetical protein B0H13DRAFT_1009403 [Mycena leptocephala]|nr:hypothetical protein B0H13DRAFT_1009403 [Mycena leptocephala]
MGFHIPPFNSVNHLHLHVQGLPYKPMRHAKYPISSGIVVYRSRSGGSLLREGAHHRCVPMLAHLLQPPCRHWKPLLVVDVNANFNNEHKKVSSDLRRGFGRRLDGVSGACNTADILDATTKTISAAVFSLKVSRRDRRRSGTR